MDKSTLPLHVPSAHRKKRVGLALYIYCIALICMFSTILIMLHIPVQISKESEAAIVRKISPINLKSHNRSASQDFVADYIEQHLRGNKPAVSKRHLNSFKCTDGSLVEGLLNDDYCDCKDGSDEPLTSACSFLHAAVKLFPCPKSNIVLFASRIRDSVKDCPDGADEV
jgi:hypothetical protein